MLQSFQHCVDVEPFKRAIKMIIHVNFVSENLSPICFKFLLKFCADWNRKDRFINMKLSAVQNLTDWKICGHSTRKTHLR